MNVAYRRAKRVAYIPNILSPAQWLFMSIEFLTAWACLMPRMQVMWADTDC